MNYELIRSKRKTIAIEIKRDGKIIVRAPHKCKAQTIDAFVHSNIDWIDRTVKKQAEIQKNAKKYEIDESNKNEYIKKAKEYLPERVGFWSDITGLIPSYMRVTSAQKRYGSCNSKNGICFSYRIMAYPEEAIDYVILHELAHIKHKNHSKEFYNLIKKYMPDYKNREKILKHKGET